MRDNIDDREEDQSESELYFAIMDALQSAKNLGLSDDHLKTLAWVACVPFENLD